jgi:Icc protein
MLIAQISDTHITSPGELLAGRIDSAACLAQVVDAILALDTAPDCVLLTGDLTDRGAPQEYADLREPLREAFADCAWMPSVPGSRLCYRTQVGPYALIALDSLVEGEDHGSLGVPQLAWLREALVALDGQPTLVMVHHPPANSGIGAMDAMKLRDAAAFGELVAMHPNIERVICGHLHRSMHLRWRGSVISVPVSPVDQIHLTLDPGARLGSVQEPPGFQLHFRDPVDGLVTHAVPVGRFAGPFSVP